jgi:hypothetical protein
MNVALYRGLGIGIVAAAAACASSRGASTPSRGTSTAHPNATSGVLHAPDDPPPPPTDGVRMWLLTTAGGIGVFGPWREQAKEDLPVGTAIAVASMRGTLVTRLAAAPGAPHAVRSDGFEDTVSTAQCVPSAIPDNDFTRRLRACFQTHAELPTKNALEAMKAALQGDNTQGAQPTSDGPRQFVVATIARTWPEPEHVRTVRVGCEEWAGRPCDPVRVESHAEGKWIVKTDATWVAAGPGASRFGESVGAKIFPTTLAAPDSFLLAYDRATHQPHTVFAPPPAPEGGAGTGEEASRRIAAGQLARLRAEVTHEPDLEAAFLLDRVQLAYRVGDVEGARKEDALLRALIAAQPPKDPALRRALDRAIPIFDGLVSGKYSVSDPCAGKR